MEIWIHEERRDKAEERFHSRAPFFTRLKAIGIERYIVNQDNWQGGDYFVDSTMLRKRFFPTRT